MFSAEKVKLIDEEDQGGTLGSGVIFIIIWGLRVFG